MITLNLPKYNFKIKGTGARKQIFDEIRKKYVELTAEEWVRQNFIKFLITQFKYPKGLIAVERGLNYLGKTKRYDALVHDNVGTPKIIIECKAPKIKLNSETLFQIAQYNSKLQVPYLMITNGISHYCCEIDYDEGNFKFIEDFPCNTILQPQ